MCMRGPGCVLPGHLGSSSSLGVRLGKVSSTQNRLVHLTIPGVESSTPLE